MTETTKAGRREWVGLGVIALPCLIYSMDLTVLHLAVPELSADLRPSSSQLLLEDNDVLVIRAVRGGGERVRLDRCDDVELRIP